jgi:hypothetical protein
LNVIGEYTDSTHCPLRPYVWWAHFSLCFMWWFVFSHIHIIPPPNHTVLPSITQVLAVTEYFAALGWQDWTGEERRQAKRKTNCPAKETGAHKERSQLEPVLLQVRSGPCPAKPDMEP